LVVGNIEKAEEPRSDVSSKQEKGGEGGYYLPEGNRGKLHGSLFNPFHQLFAPAFHLFFAHKGRDLFKCCSLRMKATVKG